jgi:Rieske Fe-S protein
MASFRSQNDHSSALPDRRKFLRQGATGALLLAVVPAGCNQQVSPPTGPVPGGNVSAIAVDSLRVVDGDVVLGRDETGLYAMSAACTHAGCLLNTVGSTPAQVLNCNCHGSRFDGNGTVTRGPAIISLQHYKVDVAADGTITIQGGEPVAADVRTPVS